MPSISARAGPASRLGLSRAAVFLVSEKCCRERGDSRPRPGTFLVSRTPERFGLPAELGADMEPQKPEETQGIDTREHPDGCRCPPCLRA